jgi:hypothetical protein
MARMLVVVLFVLLRNVKAALIVAAVWPYAKSA